MDLKTEDLHTSEADFVFGGEAEAPPGYPESAVLSFPLKHKDGKTWAALRVRSGVTAATSLPHVAQGQPIQGSLDLDLAEETSIKSLTVSIVGELWSNANTRYEFVRDACTLWTEGEPLPAGAEQPHRGKLKGAFSIPFSMELPPTVDVPDERGKMTTWSLPSSLFTSWTIANIAYTLQATIKHGTILHPNHNVSTRVIYHATARPDPPSPARQLAYEQGTPIPSPDSDPEGWHLAIPVTFEGKNPAGQQVQATYSLAMAKPLSYTRGSVIPLHLTVSCTDEQMLQTLSSPEAVNVYLFRTCKSGYDVIGGDFPAGFGSHLPLAQVPPTRQRRYVNQQVQKPVWWAAPSVSEDATKCALEGEIHLSPRLDLSMRLGMFEFTYVLVLDTPKVPGFPLGKLTQAQATPVEICAMYAEGPRPVAHMPPTYDEIKHMNDRPVGLVATWANFG
ncbi:hypothetical protein PsYK624_143370 [Phanerochaete sordida]|uniref:Arrestin-like N-terminal domain-containing protein n=1 Tax=Phanerochaete sordida TaxID=48140 RepID=A0A9P3GRF4_9APHY|nr:hypothetical protein PsYK624_143370 [Phanerochaete sordida]